VGAITDAISAHVPNDVRTDGSHLNMVTTMMAMQTDKSHLRGDTDSVLPDIKTGKYEEGGRTSLAQAANDHYSDMAPPTQGHVGYGSFSPLDDAMLMPEHQTVFIYSEAEILK